jgi:hypothetical protein
MDSDRSNKIAPDGTVAWDDFEGEMPVERPHFLSDRHYGNMVVWSKGKQFHSSWFDRFITYPPPQNAPQARKLSIHAHGLMPNENAAVNIFSTGGVVARMNSANLSIRESIDIMVPLRDAPQWVHLFNEFVWVNQVRDRPTRFFSE